MATPTRNCRPLRRSLISTSLITPESELYAARNLNARGVIAAFLSRRFAACLCAILTSASEFTGRVVSRRFDIPAARRSTEFAP